MKDFEAQVIHDFHPLKTAVEKEIPYFYYENRQGEKYLFELHEPVPSQYLRQLVAIKIGVKEKWNWTMYPGMEEFDRTIRKLQGKF